MECILERGRIAAVMSQNAIRLGQLMMECILERGSPPFYMDLAIRWRTLLYVFIDNSNGFYRIFVMTQIP